MADFKYIATKDDEGLPLKKVLRLRFGFSSRFLSKIKYQDLAKVNGNPAPLWFDLKVGDKIIIANPEEKSDFVPEDIPIHAIWEDEHILVINKQPGVIVHPTKGHPAHTIANGLMTYMEQTGKPFKVRFVNRLDMDTSGLLAIAKDSYTQSELIKQMNLGQMKKEYQALVKGIIEENQGTIELPIGRPEGETVKRAVIPEEQGGYPSITHYTVLERYDFGQTQHGQKGFTLCHLKLDTGRTHQIRVHMSYIGHPVLGDQLYGGENPLLIDRQALHACTLEFKHPVTRKLLTFHAPLPDDIEKAINKIKERA